MSYSKKYKCIWCEKRDYKDKLISHVAKEHNEMIPDGFTPLQVVFHIVNKHPLNWKKPCRVCGSPCEWDEKKGRYNLLCNKEECHKAWAKKMDKDMGDKKGSNNPTKTEEGLKKMLAARKIAGKYKWSDGKEFTYVGSFEKATLEFMDKVLEIKSEDVMCPGPVLEYMLDGVKHLYITDIYYIPYNLIIEVKDGGNNPNTNPELYENRRKKLAKEKYVIEETDYNYIRLTNKDFSQLMSVFADLKMSLVDESNNRVVHVNESLLINKPDIYYNKYKFDMDEINLCAVVGLSGSGKSTLAHSMEKDNVEVYEYDDVCWNEKFSDENLKEYGDMIYTFFNGIGKKYRGTKPKVGADDDKKELRKYYSDLITDFTKYAISYAKAHKDKKFVIEGIELLTTISPNVFDKYAVYIKRTSVINSSIRAAKRDSSDVEGPKRILSFISIMKNKDLNEMKELDKDLDKWTNHFSKKEELMKENMIGAIQAAIPPAGTNGIYIVNYMQNNAFSGKAKLAISDSPKFDRMFTVDNEVLKLENISLLANAKYNTYFTEVSDRKELFEYLFNKIGKPMTESELYKKVFGHDLFMENQIQMEDSVEAYEDIYYRNKMIEESIMNYIRGE